MLRTSKKRLPPHPSKLPFASVWERAMYSAVRHHPCGPAVVTTGSLVQGKSANCFVAQMHFSKNTKRVGLSTSTAIRY